MAPLAPVTSTCTTDQATAAAPEATHYPGRAWSATTSPSSGRASSAWPARASCSRAVPGCAWPWSTPPARWARARPATTPASSTPASTTSPGSLKARLCVEGAARLYDYCEQRGIAVERCGKVIVALHEGELGAPGRARAPRPRQRGARACAACAPRRSPRSSPTARASPGCTRPTPGSSTSAPWRARWPTTCAARAASWSSGARSPASRAPTARCASRAPGSAARHAVFCAGGQASRLAVAAGAPQDPRIVPFRGQYLRLRPHARGARHGLIYPVPDPDLPVPRRAPHAPHLRRRAARARRRMLVGGAALAGHVAGGAALLAHRAARAAHGGQPARLRRGLRALRARAAAPPTSRAARPACAPRRWGATARWSTTSSSRRPTPRCTCATRPSPAATSSLALGELIADRALAFAE